MGGVRATSIPDEEVIRLALKMGWQHSPTTGLIWEIKHKFRCSDNVAGKVYSRVVDKYLKQVQRHKKKGYMEIETKWERKMTEEEKVQWLISLAADLAGTKQKASFILSPEGYTELNIVPPPFEVTENHIQLLAHFMTMLT